MFKSFIYNMQTDPMKPKCVITGLLAKYKDPLTGSYYANAECFKILRSRYRIH